MIKVTPEKENVKLVHVLTPEAALKWTMNHVIRVTSHYPRKSHRSCNILSQQFTHILLKGFICVHLETGLDLLPWGFPCGRRPLGAPLPLLGPLICQTRDQILQEDPHLTPHTTGHSRSN